MSRTGLPIAALGLAGLLLLGADAEGVREFGEAGRVQTVTAPELLALILQRGDADTGPVLIDARGSMLYARDHIPSAIDVSAAKIIHKEFDPEPYRERGIILYCANGSKSRRASMDLVKRGYRKVFFLEGMIRNWRFSDYPLVSSLTEDGKTVAPVDEEASSPVDKEASSPVDREASPPVGEEASSPADREASPPE